eukprot:TRINITY_DN9034_c0_g1_i1.p1 TRINITY_DN9034_c0_g1~~TRINITY_DN9034_c0_g1_i1.p1  ORF type:complete len:366 (+),score=46.76 TRINITY_DN9034_c0_g1_i1:79-1098(+)
MASATNIVRQSLWEAVCRGRTRISPPVVRPSIHQSTLQTSQTEGLLVEELEYQTELTESSQSWVPLRILKPQNDQNQFATIVFLHATGGTKDQMLERMIKYSHKGYLTAAIDCRYHGDRCVDLEGNSWKSYQNSLVQAWREGIERPFLLDNVWDLVHLLDYLQTRTDVNMQKLGMTGISFGGMHSWLCASLDDRVCVSAPIIGCQGFKWALENNSYQGRVGSIPLVFDAAKADLNKEAVDKDVVEQVWQKITPGLLYAYDAPQSMPCIAPRPLFVLNGGEDDRCPVAGLQPALDATKDTFEKSGNGDNFEVFIEEGVGHQCTPVMDLKVEQFMDKHLLS